jgi:hypothetical protein
MAANRVPSRSFTFPGNTREEERSSFPLPGGVRASALAARDRIFPWDEGLSSKSLALRAAFDGFGPSEPTYEIGESMEGVS